MSAAVPCISPRGGSAFAQRLIVIFVSEFSLFRRRKCKECYLHSLIVSIDLRLSVAHIIHSIM